MCVCVQLKIEQRAAQQAVHKKLSVCNTIVIRNVVILFIHLAFLPFLKVKNFRGKNLKL